MEDICFVHPGAWKTHEGSRKRALFCVLWSELCVLNGGCLNKQATAKSKIFAVVICHFNIIIFVHSGFSVVSIDLSNIQFIQAGRGCSCVSSSTTMRGKSILFLDFADKTKEK